MTVNSYDAIPYESAPVYETHPANLAVQAALFGMTPAVPSRCRVLELGGASGGNLIPMAFHHPQSEFLGIELSARQVADGQALIRRLGLNNVRIEQADILDYQPPGTFDYVIAHGVYSWVPPAVRDGLLRLCARALRPQGVACVSYNTRPGWGVRSMLRDMLVHAVRHAQSPRERLRLAQERLVQLEAVFAAQPGPLAGQVHEEIVSLRTRHVSYLYHEYLAEVNDPLLFSEFIAEAGRHGMQYLCEAELQTMFSDNLGEAGSALVDRFDDLVEQEQIMDFLRLRMFRQTLLCRAGLQLNRELDLDQFGRLAFFAALVPKEAPEPRTPVMQPFQTPDGGTCMVRHPLTKAALQVLADAYPDAVAFDALAAQAQQRLPGTAASARDELLGELTGLYLRQYIGVRPGPEHYPRRIGERPRMTALARAEVDSGTGSVSTFRHMPMGLDEFAQRLVQLLDGSRTLSDIHAQLAQEIRAGQLLAEVSVTGSLESMVQENTERLLAAFARHGLLGQGQEER
jgi:SAM-dependent methyltransferase